jgi:hypothetical protein
VETAAPRDRGGLRIVGIVLGAISILLALFLIYVAYLGITTPLCADASPGEECLNESSTGRTLNVVLSLAGIVTALLVLPLALASRRRGDTPWLVAFAATIVLLVLVFVI